MQNSHRNSKMSNTSINKQKMPYQCDMCGLGFLRFKNKLAHQTSLCWKRDNELSFQDEILRLKNSYQTTFSLENLYSNSIYSFSIDAHRNLPKENSSSMSAYTLAYNNYFIKKLSNYMDFDNDDLFKRKNKRVSRRNSASLCFNIEAPVIAEPNRQLALSKINLNIEKMSSLSSNIKVHVFRLNVGQNLYKELDDFVKSRKFNAAFVLTCVGSLSRAELRIPANNNELKVFEENMDIVSLVGTLSHENGHHLHMSVALSKSGQVFGGHLVESGDLNVLDSVEIAVAECLDLEFRRKKDEQTGDDELVIVLKH